ncbi:MAG: hypothetical protein VW405_06060 [Rhodospirillaceae bacterium]
MTGISALALMAVASTAQAVDAYNPDETSTVSIRVKDAATAQERLVNLGPGVHIPKICESYEIAVGEGAFTALEGKQVARVSGGKVTVQTFD